MNSLHTLMLKKLNKLYTIEHELVKALPKMAEAATDEKLKAGFEDHLSQTKGQVNRLETVMEGLNEKFEKTSDPVIEAMITEGEKIIKEEVGVDVKDAALIAGAQAVEHYEIACYGSVIAWAKMMKHDDAVELLHDTLEEEKETDKKLSAIAEGGIFTKGVNEEAHE